MEDFDSGAFWAGLFIGCIFLGVSGLLQLGIILTLDTPYNRTFTMIAKAQSAESKAIYDGYLGLAREHLLEIDDPSWVTRFDEILTQDEFTQMIELDKFQTSLNRANRREGYGRWGWYLFNLPGVLIIFLEFLYLIISGGSNAFRNLNLTYNKKFDVSLETEQSR